MTLSEATELTRFQHIHALCLDLGLCPRVVPGTAKLHPSSTMRCLKNATTTA